MQATSELVIETHPSIHPSIDPSINAFIRHRWRVVRGERAARGAFREGHARTQQGRSAVPRRRRESLRGKSVRPSVSPLSCLLTNSDNVRALSMSPSRASMNNCDGWMDWPVLRYGCMHEFKLKKDRAKALGFGAPWRRLARQATGSGGAGGVDLNFPWPRNEGGQLPPEW